MGLIADLDPGWAVVAAALVASVPATIAAVTSIRTRRETQTGNGHTAGEAIDAIKEDVALLKIWMKEHLRDHEHEGGP